MKYNIRLQEQIDDYREYYKYFAVDENENLIFGSEVDISRHKIGSNWSKYEINWSSMRRDYEQAEIAMNVIDEAMRFVGKHLN